MNPYMNRFIHHVGGLADLSALQFCRRDQFTDFVTPMINYLKEHGANFQYGVTVTNVEFEITDTKKAARKIVAHDKEGNDISIDLTDNDLCFITNGSMTESSCYGSTDKAPGSPRSSDIRRSSAAIPRSPSGSPARLPSAIPGS